MRIFLAVFAAHICIAQTWTVRVEEPTGLYRRTGEVVRVPRSKLGGESRGLRAMDSAGRDVVVQNTGNAVLFPASLMPGQRPEFRVVCCAEGSTADSESGIIARRLGLSRVEMGNARFRVVVDLTAPAVVEAYNLTADPNRRVNLVETTPEDPEALATDIHVGQVAQPKLPPSGVGGPNNGWSSLGGSGAMTGVEIVEAGPLEGRVKLSRPGETWEFRWTAGSPALRWRASNGFRFAAVSASPFVPFDRFVGGSEYEWPMGPEKSEPPDHDVAPRAWTKLPGGHAVYYAAEANYGALGFVALDSELRWREVGSRRFVAEKAEGETELAITFPAWDGYRTVLEARRENAVVRNPLLVSAERVGGAGRGRPARAAGPAVHLPVERLREFRRPALDLNGEWELAWGEKGAGPTSEWRTVKVPGSAQTEWLPASDWYTHRAEWVSAKEWWYRKRFVVPAAIVGSERQALRFDATDYYADAFLNGADLGRHEGYIDPYEYDVSGRLRPGENELLVRIWTPVSYYWRHRPYTVKGSYGAVDQKPDDTTPLGITRGVSLVGGSAARITDLAVDTRLADDGSATVELSVEAAGAADGYRWIAQLAPRNFRDGSTYRASADARRTRVSIHVPDPRLWWTWDHGSPNLYTLELRLVDGDGRAVDGRTLAVGIREIEKQGWTFYLNRKRMFIRGTNYYYNLFLSEMDRAAYERDAGLMLGMNINMIRLHCHYSNPEFYDLADERGILVWQDYLEAWYPHDREFSLRASELYRNHVRYVRNHPSVALWATSDEEDLENYRDLTKHLASIPPQLDPQRRPVVRSTGRYGDAHVYHGWYEGSIWEYTKMTEPFVSELGATALPNYESLIKFLPEAWPIREHVDDWTFHKLQIPEAMRAWGDPAGKTLQEYIPQTQAYVARLFQLALERSRRLKYAPAGGILHFHAIDIWPSVTMAAIDFYRQPTAVYDVVRRSFSPLLASVEYERDTYPVGEAVELPLWVVNDRWSAPGGGSVEWEVSGAAAATGSVPVDIAADSSARVGAVRFTPSSTGPITLRLTVRAGTETAENIVHLTATR